MSEHLARSLTELRDRRGITQVQLAQLAEIPRSTVANMESGRANPTLENLVAIAAALQVTVEELLSPPRVACKLIRSEELPRVKKGSSVLIRLLPDPIPGMVMDRMEIEEGSRLSGVPHVEGTREYFTCIRGEVTVYVAGEKFQVREGDVLAFPGSQAHSYSNTASGKSVCVSVVVLTPPGVG